MEPHYSVLHSSQQLRATADGYELIVIIARGAIKLPELANPITAFSAVQITPGETIDLCAVESPTLLVGVRAKLTD
jgi:hypothetical protein